ncbi:chaperonin [Psilocybe cubensis]|uniref:Chaperonin n=1 Tax=Psilocybe cubensis TaxID=181762 RepID=A0ACB8GTS6_PSICU|nr:chaperonin [Psilocybe cubensis]KAH9478385.1 chaperonin [Psilocybe cubensis]
MQDNVVVRVVKTFGVQVKTGDGTTTATVLARAIYSEGVKNIAAGCNPMDLRRGSQAAVDRVVSFLSAHAKTITTTAEIAQVATISANGDAYVGGLIVQAMEKVGKEGVITVKEGKTIQDKIEITEGYPPCPRGHGAGQTPTDFIIVEDVDGEALAACILNKLRGQLQVCAVKAPGFGDNRKSILGDLAILTGGTVFTDELDVKLERASAEMLGSTGSITVTKDDMIILNGEGAKDQIAAWCEQIRALIADPTTGNFDRSKLQERLAKLSGGVVVIKVGGASKVEVGEKKDRYNDALNATRAAVEEGILPGGGVALLKVSLQLATASALAARRGGKQGQVLMLLLLPMPMPLPLLPRAEADVMKPVDESVLLGEDALVTEEVHKQHSHAQQGYQHPILGAPHWSAGRKENVHAH